MREFYFKDYKFKRSTSSFLKVNSITFSSKDYVDEENGQKFVGVAIILTKKKQEKKFKSTSTFI